ncbi:hypothetical protein [Actinoplanes campanulatus]|uniref:hypothetical protein n=1 Tax=Actinoplanes campanulatus TaxID=113559 RepID=UPI001670A4B3|nr:hypothetical protein [Actinoplanes campanulatus]
MTPVQTPGAVTLVFATELFSGWRMVSARAPVTHLGNLFPGEQLELRHTSILLRRREEV